MQLKIFPKVISLILGYKLGLRSMQIKVHTYHWCLINSLGCNLPKLKVARCVLCLMYGMRKNNKHLVSLLSLSKTSDAQPMPRDRISL